VVKIEMPPLKGRSEDIVKLAALFMERFLSSLCMPALRLDA